MKERNRNGGEKTSYEKNNSFKGNNGLRTSFAYKYLPENFDLYERIDLTKDRGTQKMMLIWTVVIVACMIIPMLFFHPISGAFELPAGEFFFSLAASIVAMTVYVLLHEGVHGIFIKIFTGETPSFGMELKKGVVYAGSRWYFKKIPYIVIALAPLVVWTTVIGLLLADINEKYFWFLYLVQIFNVTGAAGDLYVVCRTAMMPSGILIYDSGAEMNFYRDKA